MKELGFAACLTKPALPSFLYDAIVRSLANRNGPEQSASRRFPPPFQRLDGLRVLLAEDNEINQMVAAELLRHAGASCTIAVDGRSG